MELEIEEFVGRASYQRRADDQSSYHNGYKRRRVATGEGSVDLVDVSKRWRGIKLTASDLEKLNALQSEVAPLATAG